MGPRRKRRGLPHEGFDPNETDSQDENFEPDAKARHSSRRSKNKSRAGASKTPSRRKTRGYHGSEIDSDEDEISESDRGFSDSQDSKDEDEDEDLGQTATGRRRRRAAVQHNSYKEDSDSDSDISKHDDEPEVLQESESELGRSKLVKQSKIVTLTVPKMSRGVKNIRRSERTTQPDPSLPRRTTRAWTAESEGAEELVELSASGKHAVRASKSPEPISRRPTRVTKGLKAPETIDEATEESGDLMKAATEARTNEDDIALVQDDVDMPDTSITAAQEPAPDLG